MTDINLLVFYLGAIASVVVFALTFVSSVLLHEIGHLLVLRKHSKKARAYFHKVNGKLKLHAGKEDDYLGLSNDDLERVYLSGIFLGLVPVALFTAFNLWGMFLIVIYFIGCKSDMKKVEQIRNHR